MALTLISVAKTASKKIGALIRSMKFLSPEVALYLYKSTILLPCLGLEMSDELQKRIWRTAGPSVKVVPDTDFTEKAVVQCDVSVVKILDGDMQIITNKF